MRSAIMYVCEGPRRTVMVIEQETGTLDSSDVCLAISLLLL